MDDHLRHVLPGDIAHVADPDQDVLAAAVAVADPVAEVAVDDGLAAEGAHLQRQPRLAWMTSTFTSARFSGITVTRATASFTSTEAAQAAPAARTEAAVAAE